MELRLFPASEIPRRLFIHADEIIFFHINRYSGKIFETVNLKNKIILYTSGAFVSLFGILTLFMSTAVIFGLFDIREKEGNYVLFVVIANFICAFLYIAAAIGFFTRKRWTVILMNLAVVVLVVTFIALGFHMYSGGMYERKTVAAMTFRTLFTIGFAIIAFRYIPVKTEVK